MCYPCSIPPKPTDHLDYNTISSLGPSVTYFVPLGIGEWFKSNFPSHKVVELDWWDSSKLDDVEFTCTPCQHFSGRTLWDRNKVRFHCAFFDVSKC